MKAKSEPKNPYLPKLLKIVDIETENEVNDLKTFKFKFIQEKDENEFNYLPGQFAELSVFGFGESPIGIASSPTEEGYLLFTVKKVGKVTTELHNAKSGAQIGIRGPFGNGWPIERMKGKNIVIIGGGFAFTTQRSLIKYILDEKNRKDFGDLTVIYGARGPKELCYNEDLKRWEDMDGINLILTVDKGNDNWTKNVGYVPTITKNIAPSSENAIASVCGPPIMIKFTIPVLKELGFTDENILLSLENRMKCGIGKCGHCNVGDKFVCVDGPVFTQAQLKDLPKEY
ncbi:MAG: heterodisulfide reductase subunit F [Candidatus Lokiarchaeota archaeon]|nr:heterodisulfide reductase subunit F [Candidatus Lokiarchaeota archaeon]